MNLRIDREALEYIISESIFIFIFLLAYVWRLRVRYLDRRIAEEDERQRLQQQELDMELERKLHDTRKESILCAISKGVRLILPITRLFCEYLTYITMQLSHNT